MSEVAWRKQDNALFERSGAPLLLGQSHLSEYRLIGKVKPNCLQSLVFGNYT